MLNLYLNDSEILNNQLGRHGVKNSWIIPEIKETWINDYENGGQKI